MLLHNDKEYYPLELRQIISRDAGSVYDRDKRNKSYFYLEISSNKKEKKTNG